MRWTGLLARAVMLVALSAATSVAIAWASVLANPAPTCQRVLLRQGRSYNDNAFLQLRRGRSIAGERRIWGHIQGFYVGGPPRSGAIPLNALRQWGNTPADFSIGEVMRGPAMGNWVNDARGWPSLCLWATILPDRSQSGYRSRATGGVILRGSSHGPENRRLVCLPLLPIWPGLAINTATWGVAWAIGLTSASLLRRGWRRRRGRCPKCAYELKGHFSAGCPECGWNRLATESTSVTQAPTR